MELHRLDQLLSAHYENAVGGDITSTHTRLRVLDQRANLLGLYPEQGKMQVLIAAPQIEGVGRSLCRSSLWCPRARSLSRVGKRRQGRGCCCRHLETCARINGAPG
jgi:hypothetical protein